MDQIKSKRRVAEHGEVFTAKREIDGMLDLVINETERIESRFLEPACGNGNFLAEILNRKLNIVRKRYQKNISEYEKNIILSVSSLYGIDLLDDNVVECRNRLYERVASEYRNLFGMEIDIDLESSLKFVIKKNIIAGNALTLMSNKNEREPIVFSEWSLLSGNMIKRRDFTLSELLNFAPESSDSLNLFSDLHEEVFIPTPINEFPLTHFKRLHKND